MSKKVEEAQDGAGEGTPAKGKRKKMILIGAAAAVLLAGGGGGYMVMSGGGDESAEAAAEEEHGDAAGAEDGEHAARVYVDVPPMVVNLRTADGQARFLKLRFMLVPGPGHTEEEVKEKVPFILDAYQPLLRELRPEDLSGSAAVFRLKEEMLVRAADAGGKGLVSDVLIQDLIQQ